MSGQCPGVYGHLWVLNERAPVFEWFPERAGWRGRWLGRPVVVAYDERWYCQRCRKVENRHVPTGAAAFV